MGMMAFTAGAVRAAEVLELPVSEPPHLVDGELADSCWKKAYETPAFSLINGKEASETTKAYLFRDDKFLYVGGVWLDALTGCVRLDGTPMVDEKGDVALGCYGSFVRPGLLLIVK